MPAVVWVVGGLVVVVGLLLAVDWFTSGRAKRRTLVSARAQSSDNSHVGYANIESIGRGQSMQGSAGGGGGGSNS